MTTEPVLAGWFTTGEQPHLIGSRCAACGSYYFPKLESLCRNPVCESTQFETVELSRTGKLWSFTNAGYQPPAPYVAAEPFVPFAIAAVELEREKMIVLGQVAEGIGVADLKAGLAMELVVETVPDAAAPEGKLAWKWKPMETQP
ncbi:Zn-ribbon domain-containing OB-fold protein [Sphingomonas jatrophae]|uniref:Benzoylsuccinyl-CoA thiolase n=1 Tax=Sphingomonas jatrophae TaxID=1166337 RepID=A0A1I6M5F0_9SPHN|nr:zinc ribbon domain-containing protein [Sphingomonas jatrophae]SFS10863.1 hypothetical protein SAMN05192580_3478 [Sphingomonas jatrophae]